MHLSKRLLVSAAAMLLAVAIAPSLVTAQETPPQAACDTTFETDAGNVFATVTQTLKANPIQVSDLGSDGIALSKIRQEYEDLTAPAGCEPDRIATVQVTRLDEDVVFLNLAARIDSANKANYVDFTQNIWQPRFNTFKTSQSAAATPEPAPANRSQSTPAVYTDQTFILQLENDIGSMGSLSSEDAATLGGGGISVIRLRYHYEDLTPPAGCESLQIDMVEFLLLGEDAIFMRLAKVGDPTHGANYQDFLDNVLAQRGQTIVAALSADTTVPATPEAASS